MHGTLPESGKWPAIPAAKKVRRGRTLLPFQSNGRLIEEETQLFAAVTIGGKSIPQSTPGQQRVLLAKSWRKIWLLWEGLQ